MPVSLGGGPALVHRDSSAHYSLRLIRAPLAVTVIAGLGLSTVLTLVVIPTLYAGVDGLVGEVVSRFENKGLRLEKIRSLTISEEMARTHYAEHVDKPFFPDLLSFITSGPAVAMEWSGELAISWLTLKLEREAASTGKFIQPL